MRRIYALLTAVNHYPPAIPALRGCVNDVRAFESHLREHAQSPQILTLIDADATRQSVIDGFRRHLGQAAAEDVALFCFAGHGSQQPSPPQFAADESDALDETIVCYDSRTPASFDLVDQELGALIAEVAARGAHVVVILDCCHSGTGTRDSAEGQRSLPMDTRPRPPESYLFAASATRGESSPPRGSHVLLAACADREVAREISEEGEAHGVFSYALLKALEELRPGESYQSVFARVERLLRARTQAQQPQLEIIESDAALPFLNGALDAPEMWQTLHAFSRPSDVVTLRIYQRIDEERPLLAPPVRVAEGSALEVELTNHSERTWCCALFLLDEDEHTSARLLPNATLEPGQTIAFQLGGSIGDDAAESHSIVKLVARDTPFVIEQLLDDNLEGSWVTGELSITLERAEALPQARIFPPINANLYRGTSDAILRLGIGRPGRRPSLRRLLALHRLAFEADLRRARRRADFLWDEFYGTLAAMTLPLWAEAGSADMPAFHDGEQVRARLTDEVFADTHYELAKTCFDAKDTPRALFHIDAILRLYPAEHPRRRELTERPLRAAAERAVKAKEWDNAVGAADLLLKLAPDSVENQEYVIKQRYQRVTNTLKNMSSEKYNLQDIKTIETGIKELEALRATYPYNLAVYEALGALFHIQAVKLANVLRVSEALFSLEKAVTYCAPLTVQVQPTRMQLESLMTQLQKQAAELERMLRYNRRARITPQGTRIRNAAKRGTNDREMFRRSNEAKQIAEQYTAAQTRSVWVNIGLPIPTAGWDDQSKALTTALTTLMIVRPASPEAVPERWASLAAGNPQLAALDADRIVAYIQKRLFTQPAQSVPVFDEPGSLALQVKPAPDLEPPILWLFSRKDIRVKAQLAVGAVLLVVAVLLLVFVVQAANTRDTAYGQVIAAYQQSNYSSLIDGAEAFLANPPLIGKDGRTEQVRDLYTEAFVLWFARLDGELTDENHAHVVRYQTYVGGQTQ